jgi:hypothetical protein
MSPKLISTLATAAVAIASAVAMTGAMAVEAVQYNPEPGHQARAEVKADKRSAGVVQYGEATLFVDQPSTLSRALARSADSESTVRVVRIGDATQFIDAPGVRSRAEVRAETLAAVSATRTKRQ